RAATTALCEDDEAEQQQRRNVKDLARHPLGGNLDRSGLYRPGGIIEIQVRQGAAGEAVHVQWLVENRLVVLDSNIHAHSALETGFAAFALGAEIECHGALDQPVRIVEIWSGDDQARLRAVRLALNH